MCVCVSVCVCVCARATVSARKRLCACICVRVMVVNDLMFCVERVFERDESLKEHPQTQNKLS